MLVGLKYKCTDFCYEHSLVKVDEALGISLIPYPLSIGWGGND